MDTSTSARARRLAGLVDWGAVAPGLMSFALLASLGMADGGLFPRTWRLASLALLALAGAALLVRRRVTVGRVEWAMLLALAGFAVWIAVSAVWSGSYSADAERALLYVVGVFAVLVVTERRAIGALLVGALCGIALVAGYGLAVYLFTSPALDP